MAPAVPPSAFAISAPAGGAGTGPEAGPQRRRRWPRLRPAAGDGAVVPVPGTPLFAGVAFTVVDIETTGGSPANAAITEVAAATFRHGELQATFSSLVNPGMPVPPYVAVLTGITDEMVSDAPAPGVVLPQLVDFVGDSVLVGHNVHFDLRFLNHTLQALELPDLGHPDRSLDTLTLARRMLRGQVPNCKLATLAGSLSLAHQPSHRALHDVLATGDLLHLLLARAARLGVTDAAVIDAGCIADVIQASILAQLDEILPLPPRPPKAPRAPKAPQVSQADQTSQADQSVPRSGDRAGLVPIRPGHRAAPTAPG